MPEQISTRSNDSVPLNPAGQAEQVLIQKITNGEYPPNTNLPAERQLAVLLGITRPTLREVLQRMARNGWLEIHHGRSTRVRDLLAEGSLSMLKALTGSGNIPENLTTGYLELRTLLAPVYTHQAAAKNGAEVYLLVQSLAEIPDDSAGTALVDWRLHYGLAVLSENPVFALLLRDLEGFSERVMQQVYATPEICAKTRTAFRMIGKAARAEEPDAAEAIMRRIIQETKLL